MPTLWEALDQAMTDHLKGEVGAAFAVYREVCQAEPDLADGWYLLGVCAHQSGKSDLAQTMFAKALELDPGNPDFMAVLSNGASPEIELFSRTAQRVMAASGGAGDAVRELQTYQHHVEKKRKTAHMDYPAHVHLETFASCNAACTFCPYPELDRQGTRMDDALIDKILKDLSDIPDHVPLQISPFKVNEPFLDKRIFDITGKIGTLLPRVNMTLTSNASPITEKVLAKLEGVRNIGYLWISFNDHRPDHYEETMKLPYGRTLERLKVIHAWKDQQRLPFRVVLSRVGDGTEMDQQFTAWVADHFPLFDSSVFRRGSWIGQVDTSTQVPPNVACARWFDLSIAASGIVAHCCMDGKVEHPIGDARKDHLLDIYNARPYRDLREHTATRLDVSPCNQCSFL